MKINTIFLLLILITHLTYGQVNINRLEGVDQEIASLIKLYKAVGLSVAVVDKEGVIYSESFGYRDLEKQLPVNENTSFPLASSSKAFTASLLGILAAENKISLQERPSEYIPKLKFFNNEMDASIDIYDLLSHKSGLGNLNGTLVLFPEDNRLKTIEKLKYLKPEGKVDESWIYSNMGYTIAGTIVEQVSEQSWDNFLKGSIFSELDMKNSFTNYTEMQESDNYSIGYGVSKGEVKSVLYEDYQSYSPAGAIKSSSNDMANWMLMWLNKGNFKGKQVLSENYVKDATSMHSIRPQGGREANSFLYGDGLGWRMESAYGHYKVYHGGNTSGFSSVVAFYPFEGFGITVLSNQHDSILPYIILDLITKRLLKLPKTKLEDYPVMVSDIYVNENEDKGLNLEKKPTHSLESFCGIYKNTGYGSIEITKEGDKLYAVYPTYKFFLEHLHYNIFVMQPLVELSQWNPEFAINFKTNNDGEISSLTINLQSEPVEFNKETTE